MKPKARRKARKLVPKRVAKVKQTQPQVKTEEPPVELKCKLCGKGFKNLAGVNGHLAVKHGEKRPPKVLLRDRFALIDTRLTILEGRARGLEIARMQQPLGPGSPPMEELALALTRWVIGPCSPGTRTFRQAMRVFLGLE
jgi:hypothetical protein